MRWSIAVVGALLVVGSFGPAQATQILSNPGFESGALGPWFNARANAGNPANPDWSVTSATAHSGTFSAVTDDNYELRQDFAPVPVADITDISFFAITPAMAYDFFYQGGADEEFFVLGNGSTWQPFDISASLDHSQTALIGISFWGNTAQPAYLDDASITANIPTVPEPLTLTLFGAGLAGAGAFRRRRA